MPDESPKSRGSRLLLPGLLLAAALLVLLWQEGLLPGSGGEAGDDGAAKQATTGDDDGGAASAKNAGRRAEKPLGKDPAVADAETVTYLQEQFGASIDNKRTQIKAIEKLIEYLRKNYPEDWQQRVQAVLARAFPGLADQLFATYQNMTAYNDWLRANRQEISQMDPDAARAAMRDARTRFFGADADEIFAEAIRHEHILDTVDAIRESPASATSVEQKFDAFLGSIEETYGDETPNFLDRRQAELANNFLSIDTVQDGLHAMDPAQREQQLTEIRRGLGMDDAALDRWKELDAQRDKAWDSGERYMQQRDEITSKYQGEEEARRLADLRSRTFGNEADIVAHEEDSGFFRYGHRRVYGKE